MKYFSVRRKKISYDMQRYNQFVLIYLFEAFISSALLYVVLPSSVWDTKMGMCGLQFLLSFGYQKL